MLLYVAHARRSDARAQQEARAVSVVERDERCCFIDTRERTAASG